MADDTVKEALDGVVKAIGFGIVSDFRELYDSMRSISSDLSQGNAILDQVNSNARDINKALDDFNTASFNRRFSLGAKKAEESLEGRARLNAQRSEESLNRILKAIEELNKNVKMGATGAAAGNGIIDDVAGGMLGGAIGGGAGSFLKGAASIAKKTAIGAGLIGGVAAIGAAGAYFMSGSESTGESGGSLSPASSAGGASSVPTPASDLAKMGGVTAGVGAVAGAAALVNRSTMSAKQKALARVAPRVPSYLSKFGGRIATSIGLKSIPIFGALVGGYFSFSRFMSGDSWQAIGAEFASGVAPDIGALGGPAGYVAGVASTLAIQTYLICRDIYQEENAIDIKNNVVPNFDDLEFSEKTQVLNAVKGYVEAYVNSLLGRSSTSDATTGITPGATAGAAMGPPSPTLGGATGAGLAGAAAAAGGAGAGMAGAAPTGGTSGGITTGAAKEISEQRAVTPPGAIPETNAQQSQFMKNLYSSPQSSGGSPASPMVRNDTGESAAGNQGPTPSPSDTVATFNTGSDQTSMYTGGEYGPILDYLANSEGADYNTQFGYQNTTGGRPLTEMTVAEVMEAQKKQTGSSAIGRYQFMKQTMIDGLNAGIISQDEVFSPATQDRFAIWLIDNKRKGSKWRAGKMSNEEFGKALSQEWASVPNPYTGASYYGQGIKHDVGTLMNVIESAKGPPPMAEGGKITPLSVDSPKPGRDISNELRPPMQADAAGGEDEMSMSQRPIDARRKQLSSGIPKEKQKNMISSYMPYMSYLFGAMTEELNSYVNGEVTADKAFKDAMDPLS